VGEGIVLAEEKFMENPWIKKLVKGGVMLFGSYILTGITNSFLAMGPVGWLLVGGLAIGLGYAIEWLGRAGVEEL